VHEVSLCCQIAAAVGRATEGRRVEAVHVRVGALRQVVPATLRHAWRLVVRGTPLAGAALRVELVPAVLRCDDCGAERRLGRALGFACPACGSDRTRLTAGEELVLAAVDVRDPRRAPPATTTATTTTTTTGARDGPLPPA
jgi:hydrogenase nickel incorporation protein HypA/HybF